MSQEPWESGNQQTLGGCNDDSLGFDNLDLWGASSEDLWVSSSQDTSRAASEDLWTFSWTGAFPNFPAESNGFPCERCGASFSISSNLKRHKKNRHPDLNGTLAKAAQPTTAQDEKRVETEIHNVSPSNEGISSVQLSQLLEPYPKERLDISTNRA